MTIDIEREKKISNAVTKVVLNKTDNPYLDLKSAKDIIQDYINNFKNYYSNSIYSYELMSLLLTDILIMKESLDANDKKIKDLDLEINEYKYSSKHNYNELELALERIDAISTTNNGLRKENKSLLKELKKCKKCQTKTN